MILLDTNVVSAVMAPTPPRSVLGWLDQQPSDVLFLSTITIAEITYGIATLPEGKRRRTLFGRFEDFIARGFDQRIVVFDAPSAHEYARIMAHRRNLDRPMSVCDGQIAAIARHHRMAVATGNVRDFEECGIEVIDPFAER